MARTSITLRDLAKALELSPATVSRALNGFPEVSQKTRKRVQDVAAKMGYHPNASAKRLANGLVGAIGLVLEKDEKGFIDPLLAEFLDGVTSVTVGQGVELSLFAAQRAGAEDAYRAAIAGQLVDAFIISSPSIGDPRVAELMQRGFPFVLHGRIEAGHPFWSYDIDNFDGFYRAARLLTDYGHRQLAFLGGRADARFSVDRLSGTREALREKGLTLPDHNIHYGEMTEELGYLAGRRYLGLPPSTRPSAFLCLNMFIAVGLLRAARERDMACPRDLSIIVHDDRAPYLRAEFSDPPLTAIQSSIREAGVQVAEMVLESLNNPTAPPRQVVAPVEVVLRKSVSHLQGL